VADELDVDRFARAFQAFVQAMAERARPVNDELRRLVAEHLGREPVGLASVTHQLGVDDLPNLQLAMDELVDAAPGSRVVGLPSQVRHYGDFSLAAALSGVTHGIAELTPVETTLVPIGIDETLACAVVAVTLTWWSGAPVVALSLAADPRRGEEGVRLEVLAADAATTRGFVEHLLARLEARNVYRGKVLAFAHDRHGRFGIRFAALPTVERSDVILPEATLDAIERHALGVARHAQVLRAAGRHLKRGLLLYGPPGTGKTLSVLYLVSRTPGRTTVLLSGPGIGALGQAVAIARALQPSTVVLEDVDLVALDRSRPGQGQNPLLFQLLNEMDGLAEDADVLFVLTTNRVDLLEPALASRPGRVDQAVEIGLPGAGDRRRLFERYLRDVPGDAGDLDGAVAATEGVSAAFIREVVRRASLTAAEDAGPLAPAHLAGALADLQAGSPLLRSVLGADPGAGSHPGRPPKPTDDDAGPQPGSIGGWSAFPG
jgi:hypothetical protein